MASSERDIADIGHEGLEVEAEVPSERSVDGI